MSPLQFAHAAPNSAGTRSAWKRSRRQRWNRKKYHANEHHPLARPNGRRRPRRPPRVPCPTSLKRWSQWLRSLLEQKGGIQAALLSYIRKPILSKPHSNDSRLSSSEIYLSPWPVVHQAFPQDDQRAPRFHHGCEEKQKLTAHPHIHRSCCRSVPSNVKTLRKLESLETTNSPAGCPQGRSLSQDREKVP